MSYDTTAQRSARAVVPTIRMRGLDACLVDGLRARGRVCALYFDHVSLGYAVGVCYRSPKRT